VVTGGVSTLVNIFDTEAALGVSRRDMSSLAVECMEVYGLLLRRTG
jgi:hypothetical protein